MNNVMDNLKEMGTYNDALEILGYGSAEDIEAEILSITREQRITERLHTHFEVAGSENIF
jgi:hypothetical protein